MHRGALMSGEVCYLIFERLHGTLIDVIHEQLQMETRLPANFIRHVMQSVVRAVRHAHRSNILINDVKVENIMIRFSDDDETRRKEKEEATKETTGKEEEGEEEAGEREVETPEIPSRNTRETVAECSSPPVQQNDGDAGVHCEMLDYASSSPSTPLKSTPGDNSSMQEAESVTMVSKREMLRCEVKLIDFGNCVSVHQPTGNKSINHWYRAPELFPPTFGVPPSAHTHEMSHDVWALGCLLAEMLICKPAFHLLTRSSTQDEFRRHLAFVWETDLQSRTAIYPDACDLLHHMWETDPLQRWTCDQILNHPFLVD